MPKTIAGALVGRALNAYGRKPRIEVPEFVDTGKVQREAVAGNIAALPGLEELAKGVNRFTYDQISEMLEKSLPGFMGGLARATTTATTLGRGEVPEDVSRFVQRQSAARGLSGGFAGSGLGRNLSLRDLGLTSLQATGEGQQRLLGLGGFARQAFPQFDFTTAFITPQQKLAFDYQQSIDRWKINLLKEQVRAAPDPNDVALAEALDNFFDTVKNIGLGFAGGSGGMGGMLGGAGAGASAGAGAGRGAAGAGSWFNYGYTG